MANRARSGVPIVDHEHDERALIAFTALLGGLIGADLLLGLSGWERGAIPDGALARDDRGAAGRHLHRLWGAPVAAATSDRGRPRAGAGVPGGPGHRPAVRRGRGRLHRAAGRSPRSVDLRPDPAGDGPAGRPDAADRPGAARRRRSSKSRRTRSSGRRSGHRAARRAQSRSTAAWSAGRSTVDQSALTGESLPIDKGPGDPVFTGTINQFGVIEVDTEKVGDETTFGQVLRLVAQAKRRKAPVEKTADRLARYFLPVVELVARRTLLVGYLAGWPDVWSRVVAVLVVACPCGLVLATPAAMLASMAWLARHGVLIKGGSAAREPGRMRHVRVRQDRNADQGQPAVHQPGRRRRTRRGRPVLRLAASAEAASRHPLAAAVVEEARRRSLELLEATEATVLPGAGVQADVPRPAKEPRTVLVGNRRLLAEHGIALDPPRRGAPGRARCAGRDRAAGRDRRRDRGRDRRSRRDPARSPRRDSRPAAPEDQGDRDPDRRPRAGRPGRGEAGPRRHGAAELLPADKARWIEERRAGRAAGWPWSATGSTMPRPWPRPTPASPWAASAPTSPPRPAT